MSKEEDTHVTMNQTANAHSITRLRDPMRNAKSDLKATRPQNHNATKPQHKSAKPQDHKTAKS